MKWPQGTHQQKSGNRNHVQVSGAFHQESPSCPRNAEATADSARPEYRPRTRIIDFIRQLHVLNADQGAKSRFYQQLGSRLRRLRERQKSYDSYLAGPVEWRNTAYAIEEIHCQAREEFQ